jgi:acyl dehydratase
MQSPEHGRLRGVHQHRHIQRVQVEWSIRCTFVPLRITYDVIEVTVRIDDRLQTQLVPRYKGPSSLARKGGVYYDCGAKIGIVEHIDAVIHRAAPEHLNRKRHRIAPVRISVARLGATIALNSCGVHDTARYTVRYLDWVYRTATSAPTARADRRGSLYWAGAGKERSASTRRKRVECMEEPAIDLATIPAGFQFPEQQIVLDRTTVEAYLAAVEDPSPIYHGEGACVPPTALMALAMRNMVGLLAARPGAMHLSQRITAQRAVAIGTTLTAQLVVKTRSERRGFAALGLHAALLENDVLVQEGTLLLMVPLHTEGAVG